MSGETQATSRPTADQYRILVEQAPIMVWRAGTDMLCNYFNQRWLAFTGRSMEQEAGNGWAEGVHPEDFDRCLEIYTSHFERREVFEMEYRLRRHDGEYRWIFDRGVPFEEDGRFGGYIGSCIDVTDRVEAQAELDRRKQEELDRVQNLLPICAAGMFEATRATGRPSKSTWRGWGTARSPTGSATNARRGPCARSPAEHTFHLLAGPDSPKGRGPERNLRSSKREMTDPKSQNGSEPRALQVESLVDTIPCALYGYVRWPDGRSRFVYISAQAEEIFGHPQQRIMEEPELLWSMVHPDDLERLEQEDRSSNESMTPFRSEVRIILPSGEEKWIQLTSMPSPQEYEGRVLWSGVILDVSERKRAEEEKNRLVAELQDALARIRKLEGIIPICSFCKRIRDADGHWHPVDVYIRKHSDTDFTHGFCPTCRTKHYPDV